MILTCGRALAFVATFFIPLVLVRVFSQEEFGTYKQLFLVYTTVYVIAQFGMAESLLYFLPTAPDKNGRLTSNSLLVLALAGLLSACGIALARTSIAGWLNNSGLSGYLPLTGGFLLLMIFCSLLEFIMIARKQYLLGSISYAASDVARAALFILPAVFFSELRWVLWGALIFGLLRAALLLAYLAKNFGAELRPDLGLLKTQLSYALPFGLSVLFEILQSNYHQYAVSHHFDAARFAIYSVGCLQIPLVDFLAHPMTSVLMVRMSESIQAGNGEALLSLWHDAARKLAIVLFPLVGCLLMAARPLIVLLFTPTYAESVPIFMIWTATILFSVFPTDSVLRVYAQTRFLLALRVLALVILVLLIGVFIRIFGLLGAVFISALAGLVTKGVGLLRSGRLLNAPMSRLLPWRSLAMLAAVAAFSALPGLILKSQVRLTDIQFLISSSLSFAALYAALLSRFDLLTREERAVIRAVVQRFLNGFMRAVELKTS